MHWKTGLRIRYFTLKLLCFNATFLLPFCNEKDINGNQQENWEDLQTSNQLQLKKVSIPYSGHFKQHINCVSFKENFIFHRV